MPRSTARQCPRCRKIIRGKCPTCSIGWAEHSSDKWKDGTYSKARWTKTRRAYLAANPTCSWPDCPNLATEVDHIDGTDYNTQRYNWAYLRGLCQDHHRQRTTAQSNASRRRQGGG